MTVSVYSVIMSLLCSGILFLAGALLIMFAGKVRWQLVLLIFGLGFARLLLPVELRIVKEIDDWKVYPFFRRIGRMAVISKINVPVILSLIWASGTVSMLVWDIWKLWKIRQIQSRAISVSGDEELGWMVELAARQCGCTETVNVSASTEFSTAVSIGIRRPDILVPLDAMCLPEMEVLGIIKHELIHYQRKDALKKRLLNLLTCLWWWNPAVHLLKKGLGRIMELKCDEMVCRDMNQNEKLAYFQSIADVLELDKYESLNIGIAFVKINEGKFVHRRYHEVMNPEEMQSWQLTKFQAVICVTLFLVSYLFVIQPSGFPKQIEAQGLRETSEAEGEKEFLLKLENNTYAHMKDMNEMRILTETEIKQEPYSELPIYYSENVD